MLPLAARPSTRRPSSTGSSSKPTGPLSVTIKDGATATLGLRSEAALTNALELVGSRTTSVKGTVTWRFKLPVKPDTDTAAPVNILLPKMYLKNMVTSAQTDFSMRTVGQELVADLNLGRPLEAGTWEVFATVLAVAADLECVNVAQCFALTPVESERLTLTLTP